MTINTRSTRRCYARPSLKTELGPLCTGKRQLIHTKQFIRLDDATARMIFEKIDRDSDGVLQTELLSENKE